MKDRRINQENGNNFKMPKGIIAILLALILALSVLSGGGCSSEEASEYIKVIAEAASEYVEEESRKASESGAAESAQSRETAESETAGKSGSKKASESETTGKSESKKASESEAAEETAGKSAGSIYESGFSIENIDIPEYSGKPIVKINGNKPFFTEDEITDSYFLEVSELDSLGRCGSNWMCADEPHIQEGERSNISDIHPSGWHSGGFYQRSHLLMWKLSGCNDKRNLISGTDTFNQESMLEYEEQVTAYLWKYEDNHVMYRVSPLFEGENLIATGVLMEAWSVEDNGKGLCFCIFVYNVEPNAEIDYLTGDYSDHNHN